MNWQSIHKIKLSELLQEIYKTFSTEIVFKWWTSMMFFLSLNRFSTDLDFEINNNIEKKYIYDKLIILSNKLWFVVKKSHIKKNTIFLFLSYNWERNIKLEISTRKIIPSNYDLYNFYWISIPVLQWHIQASFKLVAIITRTQPRDLYDLNFYINNNIFPDKQAVSTIYNSIVWKPKHHSNIIKDAITTINSNFDTNNILVWIWDLVDNKQKKRIKMDLKNNILLQLNALLL